MGPRAPNLNAYAERWVRSVKQECLDHFVVLGEGHLRQILSQYAAHYNQERPHQARDNRPPAGGAPPCETLVRGAPSSATSGRVAC